MSGYEDKWNFQQAEHRKQTYADRSKRVQTHRHEVIKAEGNVLRCRCGEIMGFVRLPTKKVRS